MLSFSSDYMQSAHPEILRRIGEINFTVQKGYGSDEICASAAEKIRLACRAPKAEVRFLVGGTQTNQVVIDTVLHPWEGVLAAETGHIGVHEAGAVEFTGHKVLTVRGYDGKVKAEDVARFITVLRADESCEHMVNPGMLYVSHPTEYGTLYSKAELTELSELCHRFGIKLFLDGARLGYGLMSRHTDITLPDIASLCDVFYIGGTKVGALFGEAVVFPQGNVPPHFLTSVKRHGALLAKGWLLGIQFDTLFTDGLYFKLGKNAIDRAEELKEVLTEKGFSFYIDSPTNQQFVILTPEQKKEMDKKAATGFWENLPDGRTVVRFATGWATTEEDIAELRRLLG